MNNISVLIPTWKRALKLKKCLESLALQTQPAQAILVCVQASDTETLQLLDGQRQHLPLKIIFAQEVGVVAAENILINSAETELVAFIDDDAVAPRDWLEHILRLFESYPEAQAVGGQDIIVSEPETFECEVETVGKVYPWGKVEGNHHRKCRGGVRYVDVLKGVNMAFKREALPVIDQNLQGKEGRHGNGSHWELDVFLQLKKKKAKVLFDPALIVQHDSDHRHFIPEKVLVNNAHNLGLVLMKHLPWPNKVLTFFYYTLIGNSQIMGLGKTLLEVLKKKKFRPLQEACLTQYGLLLGIKTWRETSFSNAP